MLSKFFVLSNSMKLGPGVQCSYLLGHDTPQEEIILWLFEWIENYVGTLPSLDVRSTNVDLSVKATRSHQSRI